MSEIWLKLVQQRTKNSKGVRTCSLRSADVFSVVASLPPKNNSEPERSDDRKYVCASQAIGRVQLDLMR